MYMQVAVRRCRGTAPLSMPVHHLDHTRIMTPSPHRLRHQETKLADPARKVRTVDWIQVKIPDHAALSIR